jgi:hypothetical protein
MSRLARWVRTVTLVFLATASISGLAAEAAESQQGPHWGCWYAAQDLTVRCLLTRSPNAADAERVAREGRDYDPRLPELVRQIWGAPQNLAGRQLSIPLLGEPIDMNFVRELAESVMCGAREYCNVRFDANLDGRAPLRLASAMAKVGENQVMLALADAGMSTEVGAVQTQQASEPAAETSPRRRRRLG